MSNEARPDPTQALRDAITAVMMGKSFPIPGEIQDFDGATLTATVKPCIKQKKVSGELEERASIPNVPIHFWSAGPFAIHSAPKKGDEVFLIFSGRSMDVFKSNGGCVDPGDGRFLHTSDCIALVGNFSNPSAKAGKAPGDELWMGLRDGSSGFSVTPSGAIKIGSDTAELVQLVHDVVSEVSGIVTSITSATALVTTLGTPAPLDAATLSSLADSLISLAEITAKIGTIKS